MKSLFRTAFYPIAVVALLAALSARTPVVASGPAAAELLDGIQQWLDGTQDLEGRFRQTLASGAMGAGLEESGKVFIARPGKMRWEYLAPERKVALLDGNRTWLYMEDEEQLTLGRLDPEGELLPALFAGHRRLADVFVAEVPADREGGRGEWLLRLRPLASEDGLEEVLLTLSREDFRIRAAEVLDAAGNRMVYRFGDFRRNVGLPDALFRLTPPAGTLVVGEH